MSADGRTGVSAGEDNRVLVWDVESGRTLETLAGHTDRVTGLELSPDGSTLYSGALDGKVLIWDLAGDRRLGRAFDSGPVNLVGPHEAPSSPLVTQPVPSYAVSPDGRLLAGGQDDGTVKLTDLRTLREIKQLRVLPNGPVRGIGFVPHSRLLAVGGDGGFLALIDHRTGRRAWTLQGHAGTLLRPSFSADGRLMATVSADDKVLLWPLRDGRPAGPARPYVMVPSGNGIGPTDASLSPDGRLLAVASPLGVEIGRRSHAPAADATARHRQPTGARGLHPGRAVLLVGSVEGWVRLWSTRDVAARRRPDRRPPRGRAIAVDQPGRPPAGDGQRRATRSGSSTSPPSNRSARHLPGSPTARSRPCSPLTAPPCSH